MMQVRPCRAQQGMLGDTDPPWPAAGHVRPRRGWARSVPDLHVLAPWLQHRHSAPQMPPLTQGILPGEPGRDLGQAPEEPGSLAEVWDRCMLGLSPKSFPPSHLSPREKVSGAGSRWQGGGRAATELRLPPTSHHTEIPAGAWRVRGAG